ncbi:3-(3-hydroxy-phenyl)propionate hydroxylase [Bosea sp. OAE752]|uniref:bifunctional 3-(3-hydroxy-phenyl)propionate/3-hydroxycinnamic acid hydroxylase MhpA n=1 Tax=Bosea sp. OAE752 TaxID=2663873 RepID=UPI003D244D98
MASGTCEQRPPDDMVDVAIIGLGPVGAALGCLLGKAGLSVLILEREAEIYPLPRAVHFDDEVMRVLQAIGIADQMLPLTQVSPGMRFIDAAGRIMLDWSRSMEPGPQGWHESYRFHQPDLEAVLRRRLSTLPSVKVQTRRDVFAVEEDGEAATLRFEELDTGQLMRGRARYVVGCDGARSLVRRLIGSTGIDLGFHERWLVVDCLLKRDKPELGDHSIQYCEPGRPATYVRGVGVRRRWEITALATETNAMLLEPATIWRLLSRWITPDDAELERAAVYTFHSVVARRWRSGRLLIAGDAAHQTPPFLGQGLCAGIRDAANLAWKLQAVIDRKAPDTLLDSYESERAPHVTEYIELAVRLGGLINMRAAEQALQGRAPPGRPLPMRSIKPRLGAGLGIGNAEAVGRPAPQPRLSNGLLLDDVVGDRFALLVLPGVADDGLARSCREAGIALIEAEAGDAVETWLTRENIAAALVRPDRYVMAVAADVPAASTLPNLAIQRHQDNALAA